MELIKSIESCRAFRKTHQNKTLALIPTMGALHDGHLTLLEKAKQHADIVMVSIFVNPLQFGPNEDFERYPRPLEADLDKCRQMEVDAVFNPAAETLYPLGSEPITQVIPPERLTNILCGKNRPGHFQGVSTVVMKLFNIVQPDMAIFGEKDAQQLKIIEQMVEDLNLPIQIIPAPTARASSGLALSSRNHYLKTALEKQAALVPSTVLNAIKQNTGHPDFKTLAKTLWIDTLESLALTEETVTLDYLEAVNKKTFEPVNTLEANTKVLIACKISQTRLIDNVDIS